MELNGIRLRSLSRERVNNEKNVTLCLLGVEKIIVQIVGRFCVRSILLLCVICVNIVLRNSESSVLRFEQALNYYCSLVHIEFAYYRYRTSLGIRFETNLI